MIERDYVAFYQRLTAPFVSHPGWIRLLRVANHLIEVLMYGCYIVLLVGLCWLGSRVSWLAAVHRVLPFVLVPGISFVLLSLVRDWLNSPRPYEEWAIDPLILRAKKGDSMPSRHVFSAVMIAMCVLRLSWPWGILFLALAAALALIRVIGGVHYPRDVIVGALCGLLAGSLLFII